MANEYNRADLTFGFVERARKKKWEGTTILILISLIIGFNRYLIRFPSHQFHPHIESGNPEENDEEGTFSFLYVLWKIFSTFQLGELFWVSEE